jgi:gluconate 2-dehydrogenase alpha chain
MSPITLPRKDVVVIGFGWVGAILSKELTEAGLDVVALERGPDRGTYPDGAYPKTMDELEYVVRYKLFQNLNKTTLTIRYNAGDTAVPYRQIGVFKPGTGVGGAGLHWSGCHWRITPPELQIRTHYDQRYGKNFIPDDVTVQDWGVSFQELEPHFSFAEQVFGTSGQAYKVNGNVVGPGNPFDPDRSAPFPLPPMQVNRVAGLFGHAAKAVGYHPFTIPAANASQAYTNPYGCQMGACTFCGYCSGYACYNSSKASPNVNILPALRQEPKFELRANSDVVKIVTDNTGKIATGVMYVDAQGTNVMQPADLVILSTFAYNNPYLLLLSGIGTPYDSQTGEGTVGRNFVYQNESEVAIFLNNETPLNNFLGAGGNGIAIDDFNSDHFDHTDVGFVGGAAIWSNPAGNKPITGLSLPTGSPSWGSAWKKAAVENYGHFVGVSISGANMPNRANFLDLDPTYKDHLGRPLLRLTFDWRDNDYKMTQFMLEKFKPIADAMNPRNVSYTAIRPGQHFDTRVYRTTHVNGGAIMGMDPKTSVVNRYLQSWDVSNLFVIGSSAFAQGLGYNPTGAVAALAYWSAKAIRETYLKSPGPLVPT